MPAVSGHYKQLLGPVYVWMVGGLDAAIERGASEIAALNVTPDASGLAVDLGAGFGMHAIPLARRGFRVVALDSCETLLATLRARRGALPIEIIDGDLQAYERHVPQAPELVLCMGDTLTHLPSPAATERLLASVASKLAPGGRFVATFRDYTTALAGEHRFIPVRSDRSRILTCFLEYGESHVTVHDILHEWDGSAWQLRVSAYPKLRLAPAWVTDILRYRGLEVQQVSGPAGMVQVEARRP